MLDLKKYKADIQPVPYAFCKTITIEFWASDEEDAKQKLDFITGHSAKQYAWLEEIEEEE